uniref:Uncharacterized protein n=1 Tax=Aegilops tauschii subsp. strangulata TaxID=200361 RepID=A0A453T4T5_AEGTS
AQAAPIGQPAPQTLLSVGERRGGDSVRSPAGASPSGFPAAAARRCKPRQSQVRGRPRRVKQKQRRLRAAA